MKNLLYYIPHRLYRSDVANNINPVTKEFIQMFNPWISLSDRTGTLNIPGVEIYNNSPIPEMPKIIPSFSSASYRRIDDCVNELKIRNKERLVIFYSGGIDSTLIVSLLISHPNWSTLKDLVWLAVNEDSQIENPDFFRDIVLPYFGNRLLPSNNYYDIITDTNNVCVTGECADNLFGSLTLKSYMDTTSNFNAIHEPWETTSLGWLLDKRKLYRDQREQMLYDLVNAAPVEIESNHDFLWWLNFAMKWQAVKYRMAMHAPTAKQAEYIAGNVINFFDSVEYQQWSLYTKEPKVGGKWNTYKLPAKTLISDIWNNEKYFKYKTKWPSLPTITRYNNAWGFLYQNEDGSFTATKELDDSQ
jgi:asparagine synthetase B (glutamine-hydrolysing)